MKTLCLIVLLFLIAGCDGPATSTNPPSPTTASPAPATALPTLTSTASSTPKPLPTDTPSPSSLPATATPASAAPVDVVTPTFTPVSPAPVVVWEESLTLNSYDWQSALVETAPDDPVYPYPRLDPARVGSPAPRTYQAVVLENAHVRLTLLPGLGGRLYRWLDKASGQEMFYVNPVLKPTHWGARGWWLAAGGIEWAFPVDEHGLVEYRPWDYQILYGDGWAGVALSTRDDRTGLVAEVVVTLHAGRAGVTLRPRVHNPTSFEQRYQFWLNGMFALSPANRPGPELRFTLPVTSVTVHSTGDGGLPGAGSAIDWPVHDGRDLSRYGEWRGWLGLFARPAAAADFMGAYDPVSDMGVARIFDSAVARGAKIFGPAGIDPNVWTDDGSGYVELWGGVTPTFWDYATLPPGGSVGWQERWYSLNGLGGLSYANAEAALWLSPEAGQVQVGALTTARRSGRLLLWRDGQVVADWPLATAPGEPFRATFPAEGGGAWGLQLLDQAGQSVAAWGLVGE